jgi:hypothetical protein
MAQPVDFGDTIIEGEISSTPIVEPVRDQSGEYLASGLAQSFSDVGQIFGGVMKGNKDAENNGILNSYRQEVTLLADAVDQGGIDRQAARTRMRTLYSQYLADNPALGGELDKLNSTLLSENGMGHVIQTGNEQVQRELEVADSAFKAGWIDEAGDPDVNGFMQYQNVVRTEESIQRSIATRAAQRGEVTALEKEQLQGSISRMAIAGMPWVDQQIAMAAKLVDEGGDPAQIFLQLKADIGKVTGDFTTNAQGTDISYIINPINERLALFEDMIMGTTDTAVYKAKNDAIKAKGEYAARMDPELGGLLAISELFGQNAGPFVGKQLSMKSVDAMTKLLYGYDEASDENTPPPDLIGQDADVNAGLTTMKELLTKGIKERTPEMDKEVNNVMTNTLRSIGKYGADSVKDYRSVVDFLADPSVEKWVAGGGLVIPDKVKEKATRAIQDSYESVLLPLVEEEWTQGNVTVYDPATGKPAQNKMLNEVIDPVWNGTSLSFVPKPEYAKNPIVVGKAKELNAGDNALAAPMNTLIRAKAHMAGNTEYGKEWELFGPRLFDMEDDFEGEKKEDPKTGFLMENDIGEFNEELENNYVDELSAIVTEEAGTSGEAPSYFASIRSAESGGNDNAKNPKSSATGRYQFLKGTWNDLVERYPDAGLTKDGRGSPDQEEIAIRLFTRENARVLSGNSVPTSNANLYAAHFLGVEDAVDVLTAPDTDLVSEHVPGKVITANPFLKGMTVARFNRWTASKFKSK